MATLTVTYMRAFPNVYGTQAAAIGCGFGARSEVLTLPATGTLVAGNGENAVELLADADCWVAIGPSPSTSESGGVRAAHRLKAGIPYQYQVDGGHTVAASAVA